ncbi:hypothetical protein [Thiopseudomonas denitrificans]|uniref:Uncharacterized protein n=1 Tax=Thiopseudomonas denitrificans TaxID=1501432 RepID=A0A4R6U2M2_9GAMM|nr:hypothetical protein [Thiopseudomonas denitrificans]TDQ38625.1 hypothetical protein DFQ45_104205 [Thiopseudomonas denitrificans]
MGYILRVMLLQLLLVTGLVANAGLLPADTAPVHDSITVASHCLDCPAPAEELAVDCCIQVHQGCSSCASIHQSNLTLAISTGYNLFPELQHQPSGPVYAPLKPPPRSVLAA